MLQQMRPTGVEGKVYEVIHPMLESEGYELVRLKLVPGEKMSTLQIMVERLDGTRITLDECTDLNHSISTLLDVEDVITKAYRLEVGSAGIDRPLTREEQFETYKGFEAKIEMELPILTGRKRFKGTLQGTEDGCALIEVDGEIYALEMQQIRHAQLVLTDKLLKASMPQA
jgi:ribosome maturation factor RimP